MKGIFDDDTFIDDFFDMVGNIVSGAKTIRTKAQEAFKDVMETLERDEENDRSHRYEEEKTYVNGELVESREEEWQNGEQIKNRHYRKGEIDGRKNEMKQVCGADRKPEDDDVEYTIEFDEDSGWDKKKVVALRNCVNQLCEDAEKDHKKISDLKAQVEDLDTENSALRSELDKTNKDWRRRESELLERIAMLEDEIHTPCKKSCK